MPGPTPLSDEDILLHLVRYEGECWIRPGRAGTLADGGGYSKVYRAGKTIYAHRFAYELWVGPIPEGFQIDHLCRNRSCINPAHLEAVTLRTNQRRGNGASGTNARKTHCPRGHPYDYLTAQGARWCSICRRAAERKYYARKNQRQRQRT